LARNRKVFKDKGSNTRSLCSKARGLALETISTKNQRGIDITELSVEERSFIGHLLDNNNSRHIGSIASNRENTVPQNWKIRLKENEFVAWIQNSKRYNLFFTELQSRIQGLQGLEE